MYFKGEPLYPFGYGLSYTTFAYSGLLTSNLLRAKDTVSVDFDLKNIGKRDGEEVVQLYIRHLESKVTRPLKELKAFQRVMVKAGETKRIRLPLMAERLAYWNADQHKFVVEPGKIEIMIGSSSSDIKLTRIIEVKN
jgi:beta-glucosidase